MAKMFSSRMLAAASLVAMTSFMLSSEQAMANTCAVDPTGVPRINTHTSMEVQNLALTILDGMRRQTGQLSGDIRGVIQGDAQVAELEDKRETERRRQDILADSVKETSSSPVACEVATAASEPLSRALAGAARNVTGMSQNITNYLSGSPAEDGSIPPHAQGTDFAAAGIISKMATNFCSMALVEAGACTVEQLAPEELRDAPLNATKTVLKDGTLSASELSAAQIFVANTTANFPLPATQPNELRTVQGIRNHNERHAFVSRASIANNPGIRTITRRTPLSKMDPSMDPAMVQEYLDSIKKTMPEVYETLMRSAAASQAHATIPNEDGSTGASSGGGGQLDISLFDLEKLMSQSWLRDPEMVAKIQSGNQSEAIKTQNLMQAIALYNQWEIRQHLETISLTLASLLSVEIEQQRARDDYPIAERNRNPNTGADAQPN